MHRPFTRRSAGILLHPTSLPGPFGIGDFGPSAERFLLWCESAGMSWWQILPLAPPSWGHSPYAGLSAFALNPLLISPERLRERGLVDDDALAAMPDFDEGRIADGVEAAKWPLLRTAWRRFAESDDQATRVAFASFRGAPEQRAWLEEWTLFAALRDAFDQRGWWDWDAPLAQRDPAALEAARRDLAEEIDFHAFVQWLAWSQWQRIRAFARERGIRVLGDLPIYVAHNSAEVWSRRELFDLNDDGRPNAVSGVPPDDFSDTGQLWGNPLYRWDRMAEDGYSWWVDRLRVNLRTCDAVRLDHFRAFESYWSVPAGDPTAEHGSWVDGPGAAFFDALREALGELPLLAEDLGVITDEVRALRRGADLPGMRILQFGLTHPSSEYMPHHHTPDSVVYTGTHDNETSVGWFQGLSADDQRRVALYTGAGDAKAIHWAMVRTALTSVARTAVVPAQDVLGLDNAARMNTPAGQEGNWLWRLRDGALGGEEAGRLRELVELGDRLPEGAEEATVHLAQPAHDADVK